MTGTFPRRLAIRPGLRQVWRAPGRLQVGLDPSLGLILDGLDAAEERLLAALDGSLGHRGVTGLGRRLGVAPERCRQLLATLHRAGVLLPTVTTATRMARVPVAHRPRWRPDAQTLALVHPDGDGWHVLAARRQRSVFVSGAGRTGIRVALALAEAAVGLVLVEDGARVGEADVCAGGYRAVDVGRRRRDAAADLLAEHAPPPCEPAPAPWSGHDGPVRPDLVVLVARDAIDPRAAAPLLAEDVTHLPVVLRERDAVVGPLVVPGAGPCLRCLDLHRRDRDAQWPRMVPQLACPPAGVPGGEESSLSALAAAVATAQALAWLDRPGDPGLATRCAALEVALPGGEMSLRPWSAHPECGCTWPPRRPRPAVPHTLGGQAGAAPVTMAGMTTSSPAGRSATS